MKYTTPHEAAEVTEEMLKVGESIFDGWFANGDRIDWDDFIDRLDGTTLADESTLDLGNDMNSPAIRKVKRHVRAYQKL